MLCKESERYAEIVECISDTVSESADYEQWYPKEQLKVLFLLCKSNG